MTTEPLPPQKRPWLKNGWGRLLLGLSLAFNLLLVGSMLGAGYMRRHHDGKRDQPPEFVVQRLLKDLPEAKRETIRTQIETSRTARRAKFDELRASRTALKEALVGETFSADEVRAAAAPLLRLRGEIEADRVELLVSVLQGLSPDERRKLLESRLFRRLLDLERRERGEPRPPRP